jgi:hypothetical protein
MGRRIAAIQGHDDELSVSQVPDNRLPVSPESCHHCPLAAAIVISHFSIAALASSIAGNVAPWEIIAAVFDR